MFGLYIDDVFLNSAARMTFRGNEQLRFAWTFPWMRSHRSSGLPECISKIDYNTLTTGETRAVRTQHSAIEVVTSAGDVHRDEINFTHCRQFAGEATLLSGSADNSPSTEKQTPRKTLILPGRLDIRLQLQSSIDVRNASVGDLITALVESDVKDGPRIRIPKGSLLHGRIRAPRTARRDLRIRTCRVKFFGDRRGRG